MVRRLAAYLMAQVTVDAPTLARGLSNVLIMMPARNSVPFAALTFSPDEVVMWGSHDFIVVGSDRCPVISSVGEFPVSHSTALVDSKGLTELERCAREAKKLTATLELDPLSVTLTPMGLPAVTVPNHSADLDNARWLENYERLSEMLDAVERPVKHALSRGYFSKFDKLKTDNKDHPLSLAIPDQYSPWFIKCGPTFRGMVAPVDEHVYEDNNGPEGLW